MCDRGKGLVRVHQADALPQQHLPQQAKAAKQRRRRRLAVHRSPWRIVHLTRGTETFCYVATSTLQRS